MRDDGGPTTTSPELEQARRRIARLEAVVEASLLVNSTLDLRELAEHVIGIAARLIGAERGSLFLVDPETGSLRSMVAQGIAESGLVLRCGEGIVGSVAASGAAAILNDPYRDERFDPSVDRATGFHTRSLLTVPVRDRSGVLTAVLQLLNHRGDGFSDEDVELLAELGVVFAIALTTARLHRRIVERERLQEELRLAAEIQGTLQPRDRLEVPGLEIETSARPCLEVGGDYYDLIPCDSDECWWLVMADISGKGISAAIIASNVQAFLWSRRSDRRPLGEVVAAGNELLLRLAQGRKFATLAVLAFEPATRELAWVSAGHPPIMLRRGGEVERLPATGRPIGLLPDQVYPVARLRLEPGDLLLLYTDGVIEAGMTSGRGELGLDRLAECVRGTGSPREVLDRVQAALAAHLGDEPPDDDVTMICARCR